jgi:transcriptional regulator with XRE-family HTH domain
MARAKAYLMAQGLSMIQGSKQLGVIHGTVYKYAQKQRAKPVNPPFYKKIPS